jgi:hypothetical protein
VVFVDSRAIANTALTDQSIVLVSRKILWIRFFNLIRNLVLLSTIGAALLGCVETYNESPLLRSNPLEQDFQRTNTPLYVYYYSDLTTAGPLSRDGMMIKYIFEKYVTEQAVVSSVPPKRGLYVRVYQTSGPQTTFDRLSTLTLFVIPYYSDVIRYSIDYDLYVDSVLRKTYHYKINRKSFTWLGALPFFWISLLMNSYDNAFDAIIHQFIRDAHSDGFL